MTVFIFIEGRKRFGHSIIFIIQRAINLKKKISAILTIEIIMIITITNEGK